MSVRQTIMKAIKETTQSSAPTAAAQRAKPRNRKMPRQGSKYDVVELHKQFPFGFMDSSMSNTFKSYNIGGKRYMRRSDGVWYKPMREGTWSSMLSPPKGGEALHMQWQGAKGAGAAAAAGVAGDQIRHKAFGGN